EGIAAPADHRPSVQVRSVHSLHGLLAQVSALIWPSLTQMSSAGSRRPASERAFSPGAILDRSPASESNQRRPLANTAREMKLSCLGCCGSTAYETHEENTVAATTIRPHPLIF